ncbi:hypothetical protein N7527_000592, partial [Penicillium freii]
ATPTNTYKQSQHTLTEGFSHRVFIPQNKRASPTMHLSIRYPRSQVALHSTHLTFEIVAEPKLSELVSTLIGESNFASWSTALNRDPHLFEILAANANASASANDNATKSANAVNTSALTSNPTNGTVSD